MISTKKILAICLVCVLFTGVAFIVSADGGEFQEEGTEIDFGDEKVPDQNHIIRDSNGNLLAGIVDFSRVDLYYSDDDGESFQELGTVNFDAFSTQQQEGFDMKIDDNDIAHIAKSDGHQIHYANLEFDSEGIDILEKEIRYDDSPVINEYIDLELDNGEPVFGFAHTEERKFEDNLDQPPEEFIAERSIDTQTRDEIRSQNRQAVDFGEFIVSIISRGDENEMFAYMSTTRSEQWEELNIGPFLHETPEFDGTDYYHGVTDASHMYEEDNVMIATFIDPEDNGVAYSKAISFEKDGSAEVIDELGEMEESEDEYRSVQPVTTKNGGLYVTTIEMDTTLIFFNDFTYSVQSWDGENWQDEEQFPSMEGSGVSTEENGDLFYSVYENEDGDVSVVTWDTTDDTHTQEQIADLEFNGDISTDGEHLHVTTENQLFRKPIGGSTWESTQFTDNSVSNSTLVADEQIWISYQEDGSDNLRVNFGEFDQMDTNSIDAGISTAMQPSQVTIRNGVPLIMYYDGNDLRSLRYSQFYTSPAFLEGDTVEIFSTDDHINRLTFAMEDGEKVFVYEPQDHPDSFNGDTREAILHDDVWFGHLDKSKDLASRSNIIYNDGSPHFAADGKLYRYTGEWETSNINTNEADTIFWYSLTHSIDGDIHILLEDSNVEYLSGEFGEIKFHQEVDQADPVFRHPMDNEPNMHDIIYNDPDPSDMMKYQRLETEMSDPEINSIETQENLNPGLANTIEIEVTSEAGLDSLEEVEIDLYRSDTDTSTTNTRDSYVLTYDPETQEITSDPTGHASIVSGLDTDLDSDTLTLDWEPTKDVAPSFRTSNETVNNLNWAIDVQATDEFGNNGIGGSTFEMSPRIGFTINQNEIEADTKVNERTKFTPDITLENDGNVDISLLFYGEDLESEDTDDTITVDNMEIESDSETKKYQTHTQLLEFQISHQEQDTIENYITVPPGSSPGDYSGSVTYIPEEVDAE